VTYKRRLRRASRRATTPAQAVEAAFSIPGGEDTIRPVQVQSEITGLVSIVHAEQPRRVLEVGTSRGGTLYLLAWASSDDARILSLDVKRYPAERRRLYRAFARGSQNVDVQQRDSSLESTRGVVEQFFDGEALDVLFIDGDHSYEGVRRDYELYAPLLRPGGLIAFHDIVDGPMEAVGGVPRFWREVRSSLSEPVELVESWTQGGFGIGVARRSADGLA
jgi:predicted O-methyltransferase YrrM